MGRRKAENVQKPDVVEEKISHKMFAKMMPIFNQIDTKFCFEAPKSFSRFKFATEKSTGIS